VEHRKMKTMAAICFSIMLLYSEFFVL
jgi:hypothetical protein